MAEPHIPKLRSQRDVNLWRIPLFLSLAAIALFALTMIPDVLDKYGIIHLPSWFTMGSIDDARAILSAMMGAVATVLALIFSVALLVLSMVATLFGPRLLYRFLQDWVTQVTIGLFMGTFVYICLVFLVTHQDARSSFIPQVSLITSWCLVVVSFAFLVYYSHRIATSIQNPDLVARIADDVHAATLGARKSGAGERSGEPVDPARLARDVEAGANVLATTSGYVQHVDHAGLVAAARREDTKVVIHFRPGQFVLRGETLATVCGKAALGRRVLDAVKIGRHRTLTQDPEFAIAQIVEIAIRALSPAVNDTFTGVACVDWLADALVVLGENPPPEAGWYDEAGALRVWIPEVRVARLVRLAFDQIRQAGADNPAVLIRILDTIRRLAPRMAEDVKPTLEAEADAILDVAKTTIAATLDREDIETAWRRARTSTRDARGTETGGRAAARARTEISSQT